MFDHLTDLTLRQRHVLTLIAEYHLEHSYMPTIRELLVMLGCSSPNTGSNYLRVLEKRGYIRREPMQARRLVITDQAYADDALAFISKNGKHVILRERKLDWNEVVQLHGELGALIAQHGRETPALSHPSENGS